jgi:aspartyl-tRNA(Asn)/glutamyl-tRNA(Gln) amidotransferase subunit A
MDASDEAKPVSLHDTLADTGPAYAGIANNITADADVSTAFDHAVTTLKELGLSTSPISIPFTDFGAGIASIERDRKDVQAVAFGDVDVMILPTTVAATPAVHDARKDPQALSAQFTMFANYYGLPAVCVPCGLDSRGLPIGLQIVGKPSHDAAVLQLARRFEQVVEFSRRPLDE